MIGNAFRTAYAVQLAEERGTLALGSRARQVDSASNSPTQARREFTTSRSIESLLTANHAANNGSLESSPFEESVYETADFMRDQRVRMSDSTLANRFANGTMANNRENARVRYIMKGCVNFCVQTFFHFSTGVSRSTVP